MKATLTRTGTLFGLVLSMSMTGCMRRDGRNDRCNWPGEIPRHAADARHLSADAEFAEDLAIRYADTHDGLRTANYVSAQEYDAARDRCMASLFEQVAKEHGISVQSVSSALGQNRIGVDLAFNLPFLLFYCLGSVAVARWLWQKYPPADEGWTAGVVFALFLSLAMAIACVMTGEVWSWILESNRIGNHHMSYRVQRLWWDRHRFILFSSAIIVFWITVAAVARTPGVATTTTEKTTGKDHHLCVT